MDVKLYVGNLSYNTTDEDLRTLFAQAGTVASVAVIKDRDTNRSRGFAFVEMATQVEAQNAITMFNGYKLQDRELAVNLARPREERGGSGSFGNRGGGKGGKSGGGSRRGQRGDSRRY
ncbi:MAG: RNA-binding protein [Chloroflexi bacterium]|nr:RNA-binding protein [Chloroflexota bacterium]MBI3763017.1 RNA-binding protein [Chloroflexota bacterium]